MNYFLLLVGAYLAITNSRNIGIKHDTAEWENYVAQHNKSYDSPQIESMRRAIFFYNKHRIDEFNKNQINDESSFKLDVNHLADLSQIEINARNGFKVPEKPELLGQVRSNSPDAQKYLESILEDNSVEVPDSVDWREHPGRVSSVKNQGECGSCWAFSAVGALEGQEAVRAGSANKSLITLSVQNIVDCTTNDTGCGGGIMQDAFDQVKSEGGIETEQAYPYEGRNGHCRFVKSQSVMTDSGYVLLPEGDEQKLKEVVAKFGPVSVAIDASDIGFQFYRHGVYYHKHCAKALEELNHGVLVVGYGTDKVGGDYWIVKNSWGESFGQRGYIKMARNRSNNCGIATNAVIPTVR